MMCSLHSNRYSPTRRSPAATRDSPTPTPRPQGPRWPGLHLLTRAYYNPAHRLRLESTLCCSTVVVGSVNH
ncbi:hypothetical protein K437DRAFT_255722 [Tilletiaria anomala UBC 951]|uniref:Uncharacterized protein n=1 Tax=Tilletiaria anomala (strain ATCC 24038 / CBS 436.72 / UBC 951) TaxID=1037660 RepID=A0A066W2P4_TILAU|nr:uncharacterized protein K437DRAFT_255722 [Tilletiaria anomala UBC 951]KDN47991.1 hypothetical protein K437DRAFT_255722 [Tilletiaria anomala UBC 951]